MRVLALVSDPAVASDDVAELLRAVAALVACGLSTTLATTPAARERLEAADLPADAERLLDEMEGLGVEVATLDEASAPNLLGAADAVLHLGAPGRPGEPAVLEIRGDDPVDLASLARAGQVLGTRP